VISASIGPCPCIWSHVRYRLIKELLVRRRHVSNVDSKHPSWVGHDDVGVDLQISFTTVANKHEPPFREVSHDPIQRTPFPLGGRLKNALQHPRIVLRVKESWWKTGEREVAS
jgi:hypothetical protein